MASRTFSFHFSSEHVSGGHPDKLADVISDSVLDACLAGDAKSKVACETATKTGMVMIFGEITTASKVDYEAVVREAIKYVGYDDEAKGLDYKTCKVNVAIEAQSPDIAQGVHIGKEDENLGAGDQGLMFGYATNETESLMPLSYELARNVAYELKRRQADTKWLRPDAKTQVTVEYEKVVQEAWGRSKLTPKTVTCVLISQQHSEDVNNDQIRDFLLNEIIKKVIPEQYLTPETVYHLNPSGRFVIGGPHGDAGLTGRKIIVDTYGGWGAHGGGAFSGKDPSKVDRSACYAARWVARSLVDAKLAERVLVQVAYAIGVAEPLSVFVDSYGTGAYEDDVLLEIVNSNFKLSPFHIIKDLDLLKPGYQKTASYGHFGRSEFTWEQSRKLTIPDAIKAKYGEKTVA